MKWQSIILIKSALSQWHGPDLLPASSLSQVEIGSSYVHVSTENGTIRGITVKDESTGRLVDRFMNIPFALPPIGPLRFEKPQPHPGWFGQIFDGGVPEFGKRFPQRVCLQQYVPPLDGGQEDCLHLQLWRPHFSKNEDLPEKLQCVRKFWSDSGIWSFLRFSE